MAWSRHNWTKPVWMRRLKSLQTSSDRRPAHRPASGENRKVIYRTWVLTDVSQGKAQLDRRRQ
ncbi:MAG: hypothetical protein LZF62_180094 [Nitrospira sp.]|nr:MAG: hypothetical protein LZF62_180094 [Nitrospira sp.]